MLFSIVIPCYNEEKNIPILLKRCWENLKDFDLEVIFVNNGSSDNSKTILNMIIADYPKFKFINIDKNYGYGYGILKGLSICKGDIVGWTHADLETDPLDLLTAFSFFLKNKNNYYLKGTRKGRLSFLTISMSIIASIFLFKFFNDINAQPTLFPKRLLNKFNNPPKNFNLDLYSYYLAKKNKYKIQRIKVKFGNRIYGISSWKNNTISRYKVILNSLIYILILSIKRK